jgi:hypothetical protein
VAAGAGDGVDAAAGAVVGAGVTGAAAVLVGAETGAVGAGGVGGAAVTGLVAGPPGAGVTGAGAATAGAETGAAASVSSKLPRSKSGVLTSIARGTRSGYWLAKRRQIAAPSEWPTSAAFAMPSLSMKS